MFQRNLNYSYLMLNMYIDTEKLLSQVANKYVCWIDLMGTKSIMGCSLQKAVNYICKLHVAIIESTDNSPVELYPMIDGMYVTTSEQKVMLSFLSKVFSKLSGEFTGTKELQHRFLPRAALSYGPVVDGKNIPENFSWELYANEKIKESLLFGIPVIAANEGERLAPPFGIFVDESARMFCPDNAKPLSYVWHKWFIGNDSLRHNLLEELNEYFDWCEKNNRIITYSIDRIKEHRDMAVQYFSS